ncbi:MAG: hypothetical protein WC389_22195 [Lutibacter sp.]
MKKREVLILFDYSKSISPQGPIGAAYHDFRNDFLKTNVGKHFSTKENFDVLTFTDYLLAECIFNGKHKKGRQCKSTVTYREQNKNKKC